jgi:type IV secretion system protein VirB1
MLDAAIVLGLALRCAPGVAPETLLALSRVESGLDPLAIHANGPGARAPAARSVPEAVTAARALLATGRSVDLGLAQINSANLGPLGLSVETAFDPCRSLAAGAALLRSAYADARRAAPPQAALRTALSVYNTGDRRRGWRNGYVARVAAAASAGPAARPNGPPSNPATWDVFAELRSAEVLVLSTPLQGDAP